MKRAPQCPLCLFLILVLLPAMQDALRIYKTREDLLNLLGSDEVGEERLYMEYCQQSSTTGNCMLAIDESSLNEWTQCSSSEPEDQAWWKAELETPAYVSRVVIKTVELPDAEMLSALSDFSILASEFTCYHHVSSASFKSRSFPCDALADQIVIQSNRMKAILSICEVIPYGTPVTFQGLDTDEMEVMIADCYQSNVYQGQDCSYALDRNFETRPTPANGKICAESDYENHPFWVAYFPLPTLVKYVKIFQRANGGYGLGHINIKVNTLICNKYKGKVFESHIFKCERFGGNLMIEDAKYMGRFSLCQVQIFGHEMVLQRDIEYKYMGCFNDSPDKPDLDILMAYTWMSPGKCHRMCKRANKKYFGLQNGQVCMCGDKYGRYGLSAGMDSNSTTTDAATPCSTPCKGASRHVCGGPYENSVYEIIV